MNEITKIDSEKARHDPELGFEHPMDVIKEPGLTCGQKIAALERWKANLQDRIRATGEGMPPPPGQTAAEAARIEEISNALELLQNGSPSLAG